MLKKVLLMIAVMIFAFSCSKTPTDPNGSGTSDTGGGIIDGGSGTSDQTTIADFLSKHAGRYYSGTSVYYRIEPGKIYEYDEKTEMQYNKTLSGNKLQIEIPGDMSSPNGYDKNDAIEILNFSDGSLELFRKEIFLKESFSLDNQYEKFNTISGLANYEGNYYQYSGSGRFCLFLIDNQGNIYFLKEQIASMIKECSLNQNILTITFDGGKYECILEQNRAILSIFQNGVEKSEICKKSDLLTPYIGIYSGEGVTLTVDEANAVIENIYATSAILNGNNLTIYEGYSEDPAGIKEHKIVFSEDKKTATYTKPDGTGTVTLSR